MSAPDSLAGRTLGHYRVLEKLGQGGMGVVWRGLDLKLDRVVALKLVHPDLLEDPSTRGRFLQEARAASAVAHPNVCTIHAIEEADGHLFLVLEYLEGATLKERAPDLRANLRALLDAFIQAADGLAEAHRRGVVHRDIKSANIWVTPRGQVKIVDFGLAKARRGETAPPSEDTPTQEVTLTGMTVGTVHYMSPEQALGREIDPRSDIFSLGVVLYESSTGRLPFSGRTPVETFDLILHADPTPPTAVNAELSSEFDRMVMKTLRKDPEERYQTAADLVVDLKALRRAYESGQHPISRSMPAYAAGPPEPFPSSGSHGSASGSTLAAPSGSGAFVAADSGRRAARPSTLGSVGLVLAAALVVVGLTLGGVALFGRQHAAKPAAAATSRAGLAVLPFENRTGDPRNDWYGDNTSDLLRVVLAQNGGVEVIGKQRMFEALREMKVDGGRGLGDPTLSTEVSRRSGASLMVRGDALRLADSMILTAEVVDVSTGRVIGAERVTGVNEDNMLDKVDELGRLLARRLEGVR